MLRAGRLAVFLLIPFSLLPSLAAAQWQPNGVPVCSTVGTRAELGAIPDGAGGFYATWSDSRDAATNIQDIYVQHIDAFGYPVWTINGIAPNPSTDVEGLASLAEDGSGGVFVFWTQGAGSSAFDIYGQHYDESGNAQWTPGGIVVCDAADDQIYVVGVSDGSGGAWVAWQDNRYGASDPDVFVNHIDGSGNLHWGTSGLSVCASIGVQQDVRIIGDGLGGCIAAWTDFRGANSDIYAQRVNGSNVVQWAPNGVLVTGAANDQFLEDMAADGIGGAILAWKDWRVGPAIDVYAQRVNSAGSPLWAANGALICDALNNQYNVRMAADGGGGAVIAWTDERDTGSKGVYADYIDGDGATHWYGDGKAIAALGGGVVQQHPSVASVGDGVVISWWDNHLGSSDVFAQRLTFAGVEMWTPGGVRVTAGTNTGADLLTLPDVFGGALLVWPDLRNNNGSGRADVFAQRLEPLHGEWGRPEPTVSSANDNPGDQGGYVDLDWWASDRDKQPYTLISYYSTWRATDAPFAAATPDKSDGDALQTAVRAAEATWPDATVVTSPGDIASGFDGEAIWVEEGPQGAPIFWEWMASRTATYQIGYSYLAPTRADSSGAGPATHYFKVIAHTTNQYVFWESSYLSGYSVDNLAPGAPLMLVATRVGNYVRLDWDPSGLGEPDFSQYVVYRATSSGVTPVPLYLLDTTTEETLWDKDTPPGTPYYYIVTATDVHGNESPPSNEANVDGTATGVDDGVPALTALQVAPNTPNPFSGATSLHVGLPSDGDVSLEVFDVAGRRVLSRTYPGVARGWHDIPFDGRDGSGRALAGGVYFYRFHAAGATVTRKMVLTR